jgi:betaine-aldehyde dehydrogenase
MTTGRLNARHWIGGEWVDSKDRLDSFNPATGETIGMYADGGETEATLAIAVAKKAFLGSDWRENRRLRARAINEMADASRRGRKISSRSLFSKTARSSTKRGSKW